MISEIVKIKMPFKRGFIFREKEVPFLFRIMTLEMVCDYLNIDFLGAEFGEMFKKHSEEDISRAFVWNAYLAACKEMYKKPKYTIHHAFSWIEYMSKESREAYLKEMQNLLGKLDKSKRDDEVKKK